MKTLLLAVVAVVSVANVAGAQTPAPLVVGLGNFFSPIVGDLDKAIAFYRDGLGLDVGAPTNADTNAGLRNMFGLPDAQLRWSVGRPPAMRTGVEIVEIKKVESKPAGRRMQDPGAFTLLVLVRDVDAAFAKVKATGAPVVTKGGAPMMVGTSKVVVVRDPDGHFVEIVTPSPLPETTAPETANVIGVRVRLTVDDAEKALHIYRDLLGMPQVMEDTRDFRHSDEVSAMMGMTGSQYRVRTVQAPGTGLRVEFIDYKGIDRRTVRSNIQDPGSTRMQLQVRDVDAAIAALKTVGGVVVSTGGTTAELPGRGNATTKVAIVRDPNNLFLVLIQTAPPRNP